MLGRDGVSWPVGNGRVSGDYGTQRVHVSMRNRAGLAMTVPELVRRIRCPTAFDAPLNGWVRLRMRSGFDELPVIAHAVSMTAGAKRPCVSHENRQSEQHSCEAAEARHSRAPDDRIPVRWLTLGMSPGGVPRSWHREPTAVTSPGPRGLNARFFHTCRALFAVLYFHGMRLPPHPVCGGKDERDPAEPAVVVATAIASGPRLALLAQMLMRRKRYPPAVVWAAGFCAPAAMACLVTTALLRPRRSALAIVHRTRRIIRISASPTPARDSLVLPRSCCSRSGGPLHCHARGGSWPISDERRAGWGSHPSGLYRWHRRLARVLPEAPRRYRRLDETSDHRRRRALVTPRSRRKRIVAHHEQSHVLRRDCLTLVALRIAQPCSCCPGPPATSSIGALLPTHL